MEWVEPLAWPGATVVIVCFGLYVLRKPIGRFIDRSTGFEKTAAGFRVEAAKRVEETVKQKMNEIGPPLDTAKESMHEMLRQLEPLAKKLEADQSIKEKWAEVKASISNATGATEAAEENLKNLKTYDWKKFFDEWRPWEKGEDEE